MTLAWLESKLDKLVGAVKTLQLSHQPERVTLHRSRNRSYPSHGPGPAPATSFSQKPNRFWCHWNVSRSARTSESPCPQQKNSPDGHLLVCMKMARIPAAYFLLGKSGRHIAFWSTARRKLVLSLYSNKTAGHLGRQLFKWKMGLIS